MFPTLSPVTMLASQWNQSLLLCPCVEHSRGLQWSTVALGVNPKNLSHPCNTSLPDLGYVEDFGLQFCSWTYRGTLTSLFGDALSVESGSISPLPPPLIPSYLLYLVLSLSPPPLHLKYHYPSTITTPHSRLTRCLCAWSARSHPVLRCGKYALVLSQFSGLFTKPLHITNCSQ